MHLYTRVHVCAKPYRIRSEKLQSCILLNFEDKLSSKAQIWHRLDASSDESSHPLRLSPITISITQSAGGKDNRKNNILAQSLLGL